MTGLIGHAKTAGSLQRNSLWLMSTTVINSALGYGYWLLVARAYSPADVGLATGLIALMTVTSLASNLGTASALVARLPQRTSDEEWSTTLSATLLGGATLGALAALGVLAALPLLSHPLAVARHDPALAALFVTGASLWTVATVLDYAFIAQRQSRGMAARGLVFGAAKIPLVLAAPVAVGAHAGVSVVLASWVAACALSCGLMLAFAIPRVRPGARLRISGTARELRAMTRLLAGNHLITLGNVLPAYLLPVIVVSRLSTRENAFFYITWLVGGIFFMVSSSVGSSLYAEGSHTPERLRHQLAASVRLTAALLLPAMGLMILAGHPLLNAFGTDYARSGFALLLILTAAAVPDAVTNLYTAALRVQGRLTAAAALTCVMAGGALLGAWLIAPSAGLVGIGAAWLASQGAGSVWVAWDATRRARGRRRSAALAEVRVGG